MGRPNKRKVQSRQAGAISASRTRKRSRLGDAEPEPYQIPGAGREVLEEDPEEGGELREEGEGEGGEGEREEEEGEEEEEDADAEEEGEESGGERENEYLEDLIASLSVPPDPEGSAEPEIPTMRDQAWPRVSGRQAQIQLLKSGMFFHGAASSPGPWLTAEHRHCGHEQIVGLETKTALRPHKNVAPTSIRVHAYAADAHGTRRANSHPERVVFYSGSVLFQKELGSSTNTLP
jgi:hypothetical protein